MVTKSLIVVLGLLAMVDRSLASCQPCSYYVYCGPPPTTCSFGVVKGLYSCCQEVCAKGPGEWCGGVCGSSGTCGTNLECKNELFDKPGVCGNKSGPGEQCGGRWNEYGLCGWGLVCKQPCSEMYPEDHFRTGVCSSKSGPGEQCGGGSWRRSRCGECVSGLACHRPLYQDPEGKLGICGNKSGPGEQCGGRYSIFGGWYDYGSCESGLVCLEPDQEYDDHGRPQPGVCSSNLVLVGPGKQCGGRYSIFEGWIDYGKCESGLVCLEPDQEYDYYGRPQPGVCSNRVQSDQTSPSPTTDVPTTDLPTGVPINCNSCGVPTTAEPTTEAPTTCVPTSEPTTAEPTTDAPTTGVPTTSELTTAEPTTLH